MEFFIHGLVASGHMNDEVRMKGKMIVRGVSPDAAIYNMLMSGLCEGCIYGYVKQQDMDTAMKIFRDMSKRLFTW